MKIAQAMLEKQSLRTNLQLLKLSSATVGDISIFESIKNKKHTIEAGSGTVELTGTVTVTGTWSDVEVDEYAGKPTSVWPELILNTIGNKITKHLITYVNYDGTVLWKDYRQAGEFFKDPVVDIDPLTNQPYISMPERESTQSKNYYFGQFTEYGDDPDNPEPHYIKYSGWKYMNYDGTAGESITEISVVSNDDVTLIAYYGREVARPYTVRWHDYDPEQLIGNAITINYGNTVSPGSWPTNFTKAKKINTNTGSKFLVFKGWDTPSTKITGDTDIYSLWEESPEITSLNDEGFKNLTAAGLYAVASANDSLRNSMLSNYYGIGEINIKMGYDPEYNSDKITTIDLLSQIGVSELQLSGTTVNSKILTGITPLSDLSNSWTIALDFKFVLDSTIWSYNITEFVLFSCFSTTQSTRNGIRLSLVRGSSSDTTGIIYIFIHRQIIPIHHIMILQMKM